VATGSRLPTIKSFYTCKLPALRTYTIPPYHGCFTKKNCTSSNESWLDAGLNRLPPSMLVLSHNLWGAGAEHLPSSQYTVFPTTVTVGCLTRSHILTDCGKPTKPKIEHWHMTWPGIEPVTCCELLSPSPSQKVGANHSLSSRYMLSLVLKYISSFHSSGAQAQKLWTWKSASVITQQPGIQVSILYIYDSSWTLSACPTATNKTKKSGISRQYDLTRNRTGYLLLIAFPGTESRCEPFTIKSLHPQFSAQIYLPISFQRGSSSKIMNMEIC
jgi:hypothetical protein